MKKIICLLLVVVMTAANCLPAFAAEGTATTEPVLVGVSTREPGASMKPYSTSIPSDVWDISEKGLYKFGGESYYESLYTNYIFHGKTTYSVYVYNSSDNIITVYAKTRFTTYDKIQVPGNDSRSFTVTVPETTTNLYLKFEGSNYSFSGYIN